MTKNFESTEENGMFLNWGIEGVRESFTGGGMSWSSLLETSGGGIHQHEATELSGDSVSMGASWQWPFINLMHFEDFGLG